VQLRKLTAIIVLLGFLLANLTACCPKWRKETLKARDDAIAAAAKTEEVSNKALGAALDLESSIQGVNDAAQRAENAATRAVTAADKAEAIVGKMEKAFEKRGRK